MGHNSSNWLQRIQIQKGGLGAGCSPGQAGNGGLWTAHRPAFLGSLGLWLARQRRQEGRHWHNFMSGLS